MLKRTNESLEEMFGCHCAQLKIKAMNSADAGVASKVSPSVVSENRLIENGINI